MTILNSHSSSNLTTGTIHKRTVDDIDDISEGNDEESVTEPDTEEPHSDKRSDSSYWPENQLGLPENDYWGVRFSDFDEESNKQRDVKYANTGVQVDPVTGDVKYANAGVQVDPVANSSGSKIAVDFFPKSEETGNISIRIHVEGGHHVGPVFNFNFQSNKRGREQEDAGVREGPMPDSMQEKRQRLSK